MDKIVLISVDKITPNRFQNEAFRDQAKVQEIKVSLKQNRDNGTKGLLQVTTVRPTDDGVFEQAFGRHRMYAFQELAVEDPFWGEMPVIVKVLTDQEMFEHMLIENLNRREISFIEEAEMFQAYMTQFNVTSVDAAQRFGKTEEYIRGRLMMLNLPEPAKEKARQGEINIRTARSLISLNKVGGTGAVTKVLKKIEDGQGSEDAITDVIHGSHDIHYLDKGAGWFSANKNFPRKHLEKLVRDEILAALYIPKGLADDTVYFEIKNLLGQYPIVHANLTPENYPKLHEYDPGFERLKVLFNPPPCEQCPFHTSMNGNHYCGISLCQERKHKAWKQKELEDVSRNLGIPFYQKSDGRALELNVWNDTDKKLFREGHADLRLAPASHMWNNFEGVGRDLKVVIVGDLAEKRLNAQEQSKQKQETERVERQAEVQTDGLKREYMASFGWEVISRAFEHVLGSLTNLPMLAYLLENMFEGNLYPDFPEGEDDLFGLAKRIEKMKRADALSHMRRYAMYLVVYNKIDSLPMSKGDFGDIHASKKPILKYAQSCRSVAEEWSVKLPKTFDKQAEEYQAKLDQASKELKAQAKAKVSTGSTQRVTA